MGRDQNNPRRGSTGVAAQPPGDRETALVAQIDVDQHHVRPGLIEPPLRLHATGRNGDNRQALALQQVSGRVYEGAAVVNDQASQNHLSSVPNSAALRIPASRNVR